MNKRKTKKNFEEAVERRLGLPELSYSVIVFISVHHILHSKKD